MSGTSKAQQNTNTSTAATAANKKKVPAHRKAIEEANTLANPVTSKPNTNTSTNQPKVRPIPVPKVKIESADDRGSKGSNNAESSASNTDDYETCKVMTSRKSPIEEDIDAVKDLEKWSY